MKEKDKETGRFYRRPNGNGFVAGGSNVASAISNRHVPSIELKICQQVAGQQERVKKKKQKWRTSVKTQIPLSLVASLALLSLSSLRLLRTAEAPQSGAPVSSELAPQALLWSQPLNADGSEWKPVVAPLIGYGDLLTRRSGPSNSINMTEQVREHIATELVYLPTTDLLTDTQRQVSLNESIPIVGTDQVVAESSPGMRGGRVRSEEPEILPEEQSIEKVIPVKRGKKLMEKPPRQFDEDDSEPVEQSGPGERRRVVPTRPRQPVAQTGNQGDTSLDITLVQSAAKRPPVYMSAPKHISELSGMNKRASGGKSSAVAQVENSKKSDDLNTAAGHYKSKRKKGKKKKKKKIYKVTKYKKKRKSKKKKKKKKVVVVVKKKKKKVKKKKVKKSKPVYHHHHHYEPKHEHYGGGGGGDHHHHHHHDHGKYYE